jgi:nicotinamidase-related amidase
MQNDFVHRDGSLLVAAADATIPAIEELLELARESGVRVVYTRETHLDGDPEVGSSGPNMPVRAAGTGRSSLSLHRRTVNRS